MPTARCAAVVLIALCALCNADKPQTAPLAYENPAIPMTAFFGETFKSKRSLQDRWVVSSGKKRNDAGETTPYDGKWEVELPRSVLLAEDYGLVMKSPARHHAISAKLFHVFNFDHSSLVMQYDVTFQDAMECGGAYVKLISLEPDVNLVNFDDKTPFTIMFGPDKCGASGKVHLIIRHKSPVTGEITEHAAAPSSTSLTGLFEDKKVHLFTLVVNPDDSYSVYLDQREIMRGNLKKDLTPPVEPPMQIDDPMDKKPSSWDEREKIPDANAVKPDDWNEDEPEFIEDLDAVKPDDWLEDQPKFVPDLTAVAPDDWDESMDGQWEPPMIENPKCKGVSGCGAWKRPNKKNPAYKGPWKPPLIANPDYKGIWKPRRIANPNHFTVQNVFKALQPITAVGLELWTITPEVIFDNFLITSDVAVAKEFAEETWRMKKSVESLGEESTGFFRNLIKETESKPWLWAVYLLIILLPMVTLGLWCFGPSKKVSKAERNELSAKNYDELEDEANLTEDEVDFPEEKEIDLDEEEAKLAEEEKISDEHMLGEDVVMCGRNVADNDQRASYDGLLDEEFESDPVIERRSVRRQDD